MLLLTNCEFHISRQKLCNDNALPGEKQRPGLQLQSERDPVRQPAQYCDHPQRQQQNTPLRPGQDSGGFCREGQEDGQVHKRARRSVPGRLQSPGQAGQHARRSGKAQLCRV